MEDLPIWHYANPYLIVKPRGATFVSFAWGKLDVKSGMEDVDDHGQPAPYQKRLEELEADVDPSEDSLSEAEFLRIGRCIHLGIPVSNGFSTSQCFAGIWHIDWDLWSPDMPAEDIPPGTIDEPGRLSHAAWEHGPRPRAWRAEIGGITVRASLSDAWG